MIWAQKQFRTTEWHHSSLISCISTTIDIILIKNTPFINTNVICYLQRTIIYFQNINPLIRNQGHFPLLVNKIK